MPFVTKALEYREERHQQHNVQVEGIPTGPSDDPMQALVRCY